MPLIHELLESERITQKPRSNFELIDSVLSGKFSGRIADFIENFYCTCPQSIEYHSSDLAESVIGTKRTALSGLDSLLDRVCREVEENKMKCYIAETREEAGKIVREIVGSGKKVFKSFSLALEECGIGEVLSGEGNDVYDTELPVLLKEISGGQQDLSSYRDKIEKADFGVTDAAALSTEPGALFLLPRSGLERLASMAPPRHIALVGLDQIVPSYEDGFKVVELAMKLDRKLNYASVVGGPSKTGDIEKKIVYGAHGPKEVHLIILDDGRRNSAKKSPFREALSLPMLGKVPCKQLWPFWKEILGLDGARELSDLLIRERQTSYLGRDLAQLLNLL